MYITDQEYVTPRLTRKEKRALKNKNRQNINIADKLHFDLKEITPLTLNQTTVFDCYEKGNNLLLVGFPGTGKTFLSMYLALNQILNTESIFKKLIIVRSAVPTRDIGFQPGKESDKLKVYEPPYEEICAKLFGRGDAYKYLKDKKIIEFTSTSFIRGRNIDNSIILVDECENLNLHELDSVITRMGKNSRIIFSGDVFQTDFEREKDRRGMYDFTEILNNVKSFSKIDFDSFDDIVRSGTVKAYIIAKIKYMKGRKHDQDVDNGVRINHTA